MREKYRRSIGALDHITIDLEHKSRYHLGKREEEKYPCKKGESDRHIRQMALFKGIIFA